MGYHRMIGTMENTMNSIKTVSEWVGVADWSKDMTGPAAVILVDVQNEYLSGPLELEGVEDAMAEIVALRAVAKQAGWPVVHIRQKGAVGSFFDPEGARGAFIEGAVPREGEPVVDKVYADSFAATQLDAVLEPLNVKKLIIVGFMTHNCVSSTVRTAFVKGYQPIVVASATASRALPLMGEIVPAAEIQRGSLAGLGERHAMIVPSVAKLTSRINPAEAR